MLQDDDDDEWESQRRPKKRADTSEVSDVERDRDCDSIIGLLLFLSHSLTHSLLRLTS